MTSERNITMAKWITVSIILVLSYIGIFFPIWIHSIKHISRLCSFSGGIIFSSGFAHLLEDSTKRILKYGKTSFPVSGATAISIFSVLTIILVFTSSEKEIKLKKDEEEINSSKIDLTKREFKKKGRTYSNDIDHELSTIDNDENLSDAGVNDSKSNFQLSKDKTNTKEKDCFTAVTFAIYFIFCLTSFTEGLELGFIDTKKEIIKFSLLVSVRKIFESFLLGEMLFEEKPRMAVYYSMTILYIILFLIGFIIQKFTDIKNNDLAFGILMAVSSGTFVYFGATKWVIVFLNRKAWNYTDKFWHLGLFTLGLLVILLLSISSK